MDVCMYFLFLFFDDSINLSIYLSTYLSISPKQLTKPTISNSSYSISPKGTKT